MLFFQKIKREREKKSKKDRKHFMKYNENIDRLIIFDYLRAISCIMIFLLHTIEHFTPPALHKYIYSSFTLNSLPMTAFFFTTGYLISLSLDRENNRLSFAIKRFFRLVPVLFIAHIIALFFYKKSAKDFFLNIFMITDAFYITGNPKLHRIIPTTWSLWVELKFYIISCICFALFKNKRVVLYSQIIVALLVLGILNTLHIPLFWANFNFCFVVIFSVFSGMLCYFFSKKYISKIEFFLLFILCASIQNPILKSFNVRGGSLYFGYCTIIIFAIFLFFKDRIKENKYIKFMADMSYSFYLLHPIAILVAGKFFIPKDKTSILSFLAIIGHRTFFAILILCVCYVIYNKIEKPAYEFGRKLAKKVAKK